MSEPATPLADHLRRELDEDAYALQYAAIERGLGRRARRRRAAWTGAAGLCVLALVFGSRSMSPGAAGDEAQPWRGQMAHSADAPRRLVLGDGSTLELAPDTQLRLCAATGEDVCVELEHGAVEFEVTKDPRRSFRVEAGAVEVRVVGTRFRVHYDPVRSEVSVDVHEGIVEVTRDDRSTRRLAAGERWSLEEQLARVDTRASSTTSDEAAKPSTDTDVRGPAMDGGADAEPRRELGVDASPGKGRAAQSKSAAQAKTAAQGAGGVEAEVEDGHDSDPASALWSTARAARREGAVNAAEAAYAELVAAHPDDRRSGLAAFELGRLRMDQLGDLPGAIEAFDRALLLGDARAPHREDALARLVRAHARSGARERCAQARARYLDLYPDGVHVATVVGLCED